MYRDDSVSNLSFLIDNTGQLQGENRSLQNENGLILEENRKLKNETVHLLEENRRLQSEITNLKTETITRIEVLV